MTYQQMDFIKELGAVPSRSYQGASHASRTAKLESVERLLTSVICGPKCGVSLASLSQDGSWLKMYGDYFQAKMDGSLEEFSGIFPTWGMMWHGVAYELPTLEGCTDESDWELLPTPVKADAWIRNLKTSQWNGENKHSMTLIQALQTGKDNATTLNPNFLEVLMGFPIGWTELEQ